MTEGETRQLAGLMGLLWRGQDLSRETAQIWWEAGLKDVELRHAVEAVKAIAGRSPFVPQLRSAPSSSGEGSSHPTRPGRQLGRRPHEGRFAGTDILVSQDGG